MNYMRDNYVNAKNDVPILIDYGASTIKAVITFFFIKGICYIINSRCSN